MAGGLCGPRSESGNSRQTDITETEGGGERGWSQVLALQALDRQQSFTASRASLVAQLVKNLPAMQETWVLIRVEKISWRRAWLPTPVFLLGEPYGQRSLVGSSP